MAGERLPMSQLANSSAQSSAEHEGSWVKTCLWRFVPSWGSVELSRCKVSRAMGTRHPGMGWVPLCGMAGGWDVHQHWGQSCPLG